jgi:hypothetical protein
MKYFLITILVSSFILTGCSQQKWLSQSELFDKKKECANHRNTVEERCSNETSCQIKEIFYSPKMNSCIVYAYKYLPWDIWTHWLQDMLTGEEIIDYRDNEDNEIFKKKIQELKWE